MEIEEGQVWSYKTRDGEENSQLTILKIEDYLTDRKMIHISVNNLNLEGKQTEEYFGDSISHKPFSAEALTNSITDLLAENSELPDFEEGYAEWKQEFDKGNAGIFSVTVAEAIDITERTLDQ